MANAEDYANNFLVVRLALHGDEHDELPIFYEAADEIKRLRDERDEARREVCVWQGLDTATKSNEVARVRGWDCFKEDGK
jgi:hypothetical protein